MALEDRYYKLNSGYRMPLVGLGTWQMAAGECKAAIKTALDAGYRHIDTACMYNTEAFIGEALKEYLKQGKLKREDIFITTKLSLVYHEKERVPLSLEMSLRNLQLDYVDMFLIHFPVPLRETGRGDLLPLDEDNRVATQHIKVEETWKGMEQCVREGKAKSIGVSNFSESQVKRICEVADIIPATNQVECHLYCQQPKMHEFLKKKGIALTAFSPLGSPTRPPVLMREDDPVVLDDPVAQSIAKKYKKSVAQVLLRDLIQKGFIIVPKSVTPSRIRDNINIFDFSLSDDDMAVLAAQNKEIRFFQYDWAEAHPENPFDETQEN